jgi:hypothetical protein
MMDLPMLNRKNGSSTLYTGLWSVDQDFETEFDHMPARKGNATCASRRAERLDRIDNPGG